MPLAHAKDSPDYGGMPFTLEAADLSTTSAMGLLQSSIPVQQTDPSRSDYGVAYNRRDNIGTEFHGSQKAIQDRCKEFVQACGFQLKVQGFSTKRNGGGNAKYVCKKLNGQQFYDRDASDNTVCPFFINVSGIEGFWKLTQVNFCHNHIKHVGFTSRPLAEGTILREVKDKRNTTQSVDELARLVETEMLPLYEGKIDRIKGTAISDFLLGKGFKLGRSVISRIKQSLEESNHVDHLSSYQKLQGYLHLMAEKNPGSIYRFEKDWDETLKRACFFPNIGIRVAQMGRRLHGVDGSHLKGEMNNYGVGLVATAKDYNNHNLPFGFSLVPVENYDHWVWFLRAMQYALGKSGAEPPKETSSIGTSLMSTTKRVSAVSLGEEATGTPPSNLACPGSSAEQTEHQGEISGLLASGEGLNGETLVSGARAGAPCEGTGQGRFTIVSDRQKGLLSAVETVFPQARHRFCLRHIKANINSKGISLTGKERGIINDMACSDCENDYKLFEKELA